jgi:hypothetical protein
MGGSLDETKETKVVCHSSCGTIKIPHSPLAPGTGLKFTGFTCNGKVFLGVKVSQVGRKTICVQSSRDFIDFHEIFI